MNFANTDMALVGMTLKTIGEVMLGVTVLIVHTKLKKEQKIDQFVTSEITHEQLLGGLAIGLIIVGYLLEISIIG